MNPWIGSAVVLGHQGGWDEILLVVAPLALIGAALWLANRRVSAQLEQGEDAATNSGTGTTDG